MNAIKTEAPQDVRDFVAARTTESIYIDQEKSRAERMYGSMAGHWSWWNWRAYLLDVFNDLTGGVQRGQTGY